MSTGNSAGFLVIMAGTATTSQRDGGDSAVGATVAAADDDTKLELIGRSWRRNINNAWIKRNGGFGNWFMVECGCFGIEM